MTTKIVFRDYYTDEKIKTINVKSSGSITYGLEGSKLVVRDYHTYDVIRRCSVPSCSFTYKIEK